jgi:hypothetical protein
MTPSFRPGHQMKHFVRMLNKKIHFYSSGLVLKIFNSCPDKPENSILEEIINVIFQKMDIVHLFLIRYRKFLG